MRFCLSPAGSFAAIPSKSAAHRAVICAALCGGESLIRNMPHCRDIEATLASVQALGARVRQGAEGTYIKGISAKQKRVLLPCGDSASTLRMLYPLAPLMAEEAFLDISDALTRRPMAPITELLRTKGVSAEARRVSGSYTAGDFPIAGDISSQFISGLLFALTTLSDESRIILTAPLQSRSYVELTRHVLSRFGGESRWISGSVLTVYPRKLHPADFTVEGDYSNAAMLLCAGAVYGNVTVTGLDPDSLQGDRAIVHILRRMGAEAAVQGDAVTVERSRLHGIDIDASDIPDLVPAICMAALAAEGETRIFNAARLRIKESDRLAAIAAELGRLGADISKRPDGLTIRGGRPLHPAVVFSHNDHRIAMMLILISGLCGGIDIDDVTCIDKSYKGFLQVIGAE